MCPIQLIVQYNPTNSCKIDGWIDGWQFLNPIPWNERTCRKLRNPWSRYTTLKWLVWNRPRRLYGLYSEVWMLEEQPSWQWQLWKGRWRCAWRSPSPRKTCWKTSPPRGWVPAIFAGRRGGLPTLLWDNELLNTKLEKQQLLLRWRKPCGLLRRSGAALPPAHFRSVLWRTTPGRKQVMNKRGWWRTMGWRGSQGLQWICKLFRVVLGAWRQEERRGQKTHGWNGQVLLLWLWMPTTNSTWGRKSHYGESHEFVWPHWTLSPCGPSMDGVSQIWVIRTHWKSDHVAEKCIFPQKSGRL